ncbi:hypothetical protein BDV40DRAFT_283525 [Aspergillus tamarii]|uniref:Uncharacterized protein n=1 Tax=Aspergillus tamarii TaxID=41984 RepID=A0A5N6UAB5_ASPTM|nr:hypothetical protein BDV40DRAFT_283525 [Aspergillus tamarii]
MSSSLKAFLNQNPHISYVDSSKSQHASLRTSFINEASVVPQEAILRSTFLAVSLYISRPMTSQIPGSFPPSIGCLDNRYM